MMVTPASSSLLKDLAVEAKQFVCQVVKEVYEVLHLPAGGAEPAGQPDSAVVAEA